MIGDLDWQKRGGAIPPVVWIQYNAGVVHGIYIAAGIATVAALAIVGGIGFPRVPKELRLLVGMLLLLEIPMCALAFYGIRLPVVGPFWLWVMEHWFSHLDPVTMRKLHILFRMTDAPLTEELAKLWPLLLPLVAKKIQKEHAVWIAVALGLGFGIGEVWFLAHTIAKSAPELGNYPWYYFGGFINERVMVCLMHGAFTAAALVRWKKGFGWGILAAMGLHFIGNFPIYFKIINLFGWSAETWGRILGVWVIFYFWMMIVLLTYLYYGQYKVGMFLFGKVRCPGCDVVYERSLWGLNLFHLRYERCPACKKFHLVGHQHRSKE
jgi:hypothetical protein